MVTLVAKPTERSASSRATSRRSTSTTQENKDNRQEPRTRCSTRTSLASRDVARRPNVHDSWYHRDRPQPECEPGDRWNKNKIGISSTEDDGESHAAIDTSTPTANGRSTDGTRRITFVTAIVRTAGGTIRCLTSELARARLRNARGSQWNDYSSAGWTRSWESIVDLSSKGETTAANSTSNHPGAEPPQFNGDRRKQRAFHQVVPTRTDRTSGSEARRRIFGRGSRRSRRLHRRP